MNERRGVNTPDMVNEGSNGVSSERSKTPWTATPDASLPIGLKPADRAIGQLFQNISMSPHGAKESYASPRVMQTADSNLEYEKVATQMMETLGDECEEVCLMLEYALGLRDKWLFDDSKGACPIVGTPDKALPLPPKSRHECRMVDGAGGITRTRRENQNGALLRHGRRISFTICTHCCACSLTVRRRRFAQEVAAHGAKVQSSRHAQRR